MKITELLLLLSAFSLTNSYNILGLFPMGTKSHMVMFERLMKGLAEKGHEVDVLSPFPQKKPIARYHDLSLANDIPILVNNVSVSFVESSLSGIFDIIKFILVDAGYETCKTVFNSTEAKKLLTTNKTYDLIITELFGSDCMLGYAHHFKVPVITVTSSVNLPWSSDRIGNPDHPAYITNYFLPYLCSMSILQRIMNMIVLIGTKIWYLFALENSTAVARDFFGPDLPHLSQLTQNTSLMLVNSHFSINQARPTVPNFVEVGGLHIEELRSLSQYFEDSLNISNQYKGVIYLSMGSMLLTETMPTHKIKALFEAFRQLPYKVLWKATEKNFPKKLDIPSNIQFEKWMPQLEILCHPNVKLFISHGGLMGTQESIYCGVPRLGIPFFADQELNLRTSEKLGLAIMMKYDDITEENVLRNVRALLEDEQYKKNVERMSKLFRDRPNSALETAIYWVEYVIRQNGAPHLRSAGADLHWFQYYMLDVFAIVMFVSMAVISVVYYLIHFSLRILLKHFNYKSKNE